MIFGIFEIISEFGLDLIEKVSYLGIFIISFLENVFTPVPSEAIIPFTGILVSQGRMNIYLVITAATLGSVIGAYFFYYVGYFLGSDQIRGWIVKWGKYLFVTETDIKRAEDWFAKYEAWAVLICRVVPIVRSFISVPAGYVKMPLLKFTVLTMVGTAVWSTFLVYLGIIYGNNYTQFVPYFRKLDFVFLAIFVLISIYYFYRQYQQKKNTSSKSS